MIRLYLDWNVISKLLDNDESLDAFSDAIIRNRREFVVPFSEAHIKDFISSSSVTPNLGVLEGLRSLTQCNFTCFSTTLNRSYITFLDPSTIYEMLMNQKKEGVDLESILNDRERKLKREIVEEADKAIFDYSVRSIHTTKSSTRQQPESTDVSVIEAILALKKEVQEMPEWFVSGQAYKEGRNRIRGGLDLPKDRLSNSSLPFEEINRAMRKYTSNPNIRVEYISQIIKNMRPQYDSLHTDVTCLYIILDDLGFHSDKFGKKNKPKNLIVDIQHALLGAFCDYYVTLDKKHSLKTKVVYKCIGTSCVVCTPFEFIDKYRNTIEQ